MHYSSITVGADWFRVQWDVARENAPLDWQRVLAIPGVRYYPKALEIPRTAWTMSEVLDFCAALEITPPKHVNKYVGIGLWQPDRKPLAHQPAVTHRLLEQHRVLLADQLGLGKTSSAIQAAETVRRHVFHGNRPVVILGPLRTRATWCKELLAMGAIADKSEFCALHTRDLTQSGIWRDDAPYYFVHYDVIDAWWSRFTHLRPCVTILDEAQYVKNSGSRRCRNAAMVAHIAPFRLIVTGTPIANAPKDLYSILDLLNGPQTWGTQNQYRERYCGAERNNYGLVDMGPTRVEELRARLEPFYIRREVSDTSVELPAFRRELVEVETSAEREKTYRQHTNVLNAEDVRKLVSAVCSGAPVGPSDDTLRMLNSLRQVTSDIKIPATAELATSILEADGAVVVFTWQRATASLLQRMIDPTRNAITGVLPIEQRNGLIDRFQAEGGGLVATYGALADAVTLHRARAAIMHDLDYVPSTMLQAEKRIHRIGQQHGCTVYWMIAPHFFDRILVSVLRQKCADTEMVFSLKEQIAELTQRDPLDNFTVWMEQAIKDWKTWKI